MGKQQDLQESEVRQFERAEAGDGRWGAEAGRPRPLLRAYNSTRRRFLSAQVETAGFAPHSIDACLAALTPGSGRALWIVPSREISPVSVRVPVDLLYLDRNLVVVETIESFPISTASPVSSVVESLLALPADTIASGRIRPGDSLIVCSPEQMKLRLDELTRTTGDAYGNLNTDSGLSAAAEAAGGEIGKALIPDNRSHRAAANSSAKAVRDAESPSRAAVSMLPPENFAPASSLGKGMTKWLRRLLWGEPREPRRSTRESLSWLVVYFFTGGTPVAHTVRDVSLNGMYVLTEERWYLGTVIRMTLTDRRDPCVDRSITLNAKVVRWGSDGVGLEFLLQESKVIDSCVTGAPDDGFVKVSEVQIEKFLRRIRDGIR